MILGSSSATYLPDGPDYENYSLYGGQTPSFPGPGWGMPSSPAYAAARPLDVMARGNQYQGSGAFAPPGGINFGNPLLNGLGSNLLTSLFGGELRPIMRPDIPAFDYLQARQRFQISQTMNDRILAADPIYGNASIPQIAQTRAGQAIYDMFNPGGSQNQAFQTIYGRFGPGFGGNMQDQAESSLGMLGQINKAFVGSGKRAGMWDYNQSFGFSRVDTAEALDSAARYGVGGLSMDQVTQAAGRNDGSLTSMARKNNQLFSQARDIFGGDKGFDELAQLMSKSIEGLAGLDSTKASDLLNRIQSTSRAVNVSTQAFAEYASMFNQLYRDRNIGGATAVEGVATAMQDAKVVSSTSRASGDMIAGDQNRVANARGQQIARATNSRMFNMASAIGLTFEDMTDSQKSGVVMGDGRTLKDWEGDFGRAMASGDTQTVNRFQSNFFENLGANQFFSKGDLLLRARNLSPEDRERIKDRAPWAKDASSFQNNRFLKALDQRIASRLDDGLEAKLSGMGVSLSEFRQGFQATELTDPTRIREKINTDPRFASLSQEERDNLALGVSQGSQVINNEPFLRQFFDGDDPRALSRATVNGDSLIGRTEARKLESKRQKDDLRQRYMAGLSGASLKNFDLKEFVGIVTQNFDKLAGIFGEGGVPDMDKAKAAFFEITKDVVKTDEMAVMMKAIQGQGMEDTVNKAQAEFDRVKSETGSSTKAAKARDAVLESSRQNFLKQWNEGGLAGALGGASVNDNQDPNNVVSAPWSKAGNQDPNNVTSGFSPDIDAMVFDKAQSKSSADPRTPTSTSPDEEQTRLFRSMDEHLRQIAEGKSSRTVLIPAATKNTHLF